MTIQQRWMAVILAAGWLIGGGSRLGAAGNRDAAWAKVDAAVAKGLPQTALAELEPIYQGALRDKAYPEAVKALGRRIVLEGGVAGRSAEELITRLQAELPKAPKEMRPVLDTLLADWYWRYFQENRWRFMQRTATAEAPGKDFKTWDLPRLFAEIDRQFRQALFGADVLKRIPIAQYDALFPKGTLPDQVRPTLYDFIAQEALRFYTSGEQAAAKPEDAFEVAADSPALGTVAEFLAWKLPAGEADAPGLRALQLYQDVLRFHLRDADPAALWDADLGRLRFAYSVANGEEKEARYTTALTAFVTRCDGREPAPAAFALLAGMREQAGDLLQAHRWAELGAKGAATSAGAAECRNLLVRLELKDLNVSTEGVWNGADTQIQVGYRNLGRVYFRLVAGDWKLYLQRNHSRPENLSDADKRPLLSAKPVAAWTAPLTGTNDYASHTLKLPVPTGIKPGFYFLLASPSEDFVGQDHPVTYADVWVSDLALVLRPRAGRLEGLVLEARSGEPLAGARVEAWHLDNQGNRVPETPMVTDADGFFAFSAGAERSYVLRATHQGRELATGDQSVWPVPERPRSEDRTVLFPDRAIYRPGQTIQYKGICLRLDPEQDNYSVLPRREVTVVFHDGNGKEIERQQRTVNDFGSFAGSFTAPRDRLAGRMLIEILVGPPGQTMVQVEEYKRPKFVTTLDAPAAGAKLGEKTTVTGHALGYTGAAVDGARVAYHVRREASFPVWSRYFGGGWPGAPGGQELAHGTTTTGPDGTFQITFLARPDAAISAQEEPVFTYHVTADVTDAAGETRSGETLVRAGYTALQAELTIGDWQTATQAVKVVVATKTLDGTGQTAEGTLRIYPVKEPAAVPRAGLRVENPGYGGRFGYRRPGYFMPLEPAPKVEEELPVGPPVVTQGTVTDAGGRKEIGVQLAPGRYRATWETQDRFGKPVTARASFMVMDPRERRLAAKVPQYLGAPAWSLEPGQELAAVWGTGYGEGRAFVEVEHRNRIIQRYWTPKGVTQTGIRQAVSEAMRGGFTLHVTQVRENRAYLESRSVAVPWSNKDLTIKWEHFTSRLEPGTKETWTAVIRGPKSTLVAAEMAATLYDASLDAFAPLAWPGALGDFREERSTAQAVFVNAEGELRGLFGYWQPQFSPVPPVNYREFPAELAVGPSRFLGRGFGGAALGVTRMAKGAAMPMDALTTAAPMVAPAMPAASTRSDLSAEGMTMSGDAAKPMKAALPVASPPGPVPTPNLQQISARANLNESAFFFPQLQADTNGVVQMSFTMPEALTRWRFLALAHDRELRSGRLEAEMVTAKELMVQPNPPRFVREGDVLEFTVKVTNQSTNRQTGKVRLTFAEAATGAGADERLGNTKPELALDVPAKESRSYSWRIQVPDGLPFLSYKAVAAGGRFTDGEEGFLPVLARRILVTESLTLPIRGPGTNRFEFTKLLHSTTTGSAGVRHQALKVEMTSHPAWYAVMALPYLMEYPHECAEQTFNRFYANALARVIAQSDPKIHRVFEQWRGTAALASPLEKNQDLKSLLVEETPWYRDAQAEAAARRNVGVLFDDNRLNYETTRVLGQLREAQQGDGAWAWFAGGRPDDYITLYIVTGFGRLRHLGVDVDTAPAVRALSRLDTWVDKQYREILKAGHPDADHLNSTVALYLYGRSFFLKERPVGARTREAVDYYLGQARKYALGNGERQLQAHLALALQRFGDTNTPAAIMKSLKERSLYSAELGRYWADQGEGWWWYRAPIETQALMIEAFAEVAHDAAAVEECQVWLLKQKQTGNWPTTKGTADAVYALLLQGRSQLTSDALVQVSLGGVAVKPVRAKAGTGFYEQRWTGPEVKAAQGAVTVAKQDAGVAWGAVYWQYWQDVGKVTPHTGTPLTVVKRLFVKRRTAKGAVLEPVTGALAVGDELVVRLELRADRAMEYVHLKDQRASGVEPLKVLSQHHYQDGLAYYETTRDTASHFFIQYVPKGTYVLEYGARVVHRGEYQSGLAEAQCLYAPEFNSHSESLALRVR